jgi:hypothetical protein
MANISAMSTVGAISSALAVNGSFNLYMGFGGTNWAYNGGANGGGTSFQPVITSYDYDAPVQVRESNANSRMLRGCPAVFHRHSLPCALPPTL